MPDVELLEFKTGKSTPVHISNIQWRGEESTLRSELEIVFSEYGLIDSLHVGVSDAPQDGIWYAYVNYFSDRSAKSAISSRSNLMISGKPCRVRTGANRQWRRRDLDKDDPSDIDDVLSLRKCEQLANHYLGFNGWSSSVLHHKLENGNTYATAVRLTFHPFYEPAVSVDGVGVATVKITDENNPIEKCREIPMARKFSRCAAMLQAFSKVILVLIHPQDHETSASSKPKVAVRVDHSRKEPFSYQSVWDEEPEAEAVFRHVARDFDSDDDLFED